jgi:helix-turn-helix protein
MPWSNTTPMDQKTQFIADHLRETLSMSELCELYAISRKTGYKIVDRYLRHGPAGLEERSGDPTTIPTRHPSTSFRPLSHYASGIPHGAPRNCSRCWKSVIPVRTCPGALPCAISSVARGWCASRALVATSATPVSLAARSWRLTTCGAPISKATSKPATVSIATH